MASGLAIPGTEATAFSDLHRHQSGKMASEKRQSFDTTAFKKGIERLSAAIATSRVLAPFRPIKMVSSGGFVSVVYLRNRPASQDLDYFLNSSHYGPESMYQRVRTELRRLINTVAESLQYDPNWATDEVTVFLSLLRDPGALFQQSLDQNIVLYSDSSLSIYAVKWEWVLARKMKRLQMEDQIGRREDWDDCVSISKLLHSAGTAPPARLKLEVLRRFDDSDKESPVLPETINALNNICNQIHHFRPFPDSYWTCSSKTGALSYTWDDGSMVPRDQWPRQQGQASILVQETGNWRRFDFQKRAWVSE